MGPALRLTASPVVPMRHGQGARDFRSGQGRESWMTRHRAPALLAPLVAHNDGYALSIRSGRQRLIDWDPVAVGVTGRTGCAAGQTSNCSVCSSRSGEGTGHRGTPPVHGGRLLPHAEEEGCLITHSPAVHVRRSTHRLRSPTP